MTESPFTWEPLPPQETPDQVVMSPEEAQQAALGLQTAPGRYYTKLQEFYGFVGMLLFPLDPVCGGAILVNAEQTARSLDRLAREHKSVERIVKLMTQSTGLGLFLGAHAQIAFTIFQHHAPDSAKGYLLMMFRAPFARPEEENGQVDEATARAATREAPLN